MKTDGEKKQRPEILRVLPYVSNASEATERLLRPLGVGVGHRPEATIRRLIMQPKDRLPPADTSGVIYRVKCLDCPANYCGMTDKRLRTRMHEHTLAGRRKDVLSHVAMQSLENNHKFDFDGAQVHYHSLTPERINPNLYVEGRVCLSLLGTWKGHSTENWSSDFSNLLQVLVSLQGNLTAPVVCLPVSHRLQINGRMAYVRLKGHFTNISFVAVYALNSATEQRDKEAFYSQLQALVERLPRRDLLIVGGRTGPGDPTTSHLLGRFGLGSRCENGERLLNFADRNRLLVTNTCFQHRKKRLLTWYSNNGRTASQIDYIQVSSRFRSWVHDSRSMRGAETGNAHGSDHVLVRTRLKVHLSSAPKMPRPRRLNVAKIRQASTAEALSREIWTCFTARADGEVSNQWSSLRTSVYGAAEQILGYTQRRRSDWISGRTLQLSAQTARARSRNDDYFRQLRKMTV
nr:unnamed protein product [Spirometra erinaceieuropaei]